MNELKEVFNNLEYYLDQKVDNDVLDNMDLKTYLLFKERENSRLFGIPRIGGEWVDKEGDSVWKPNPDVIPDPENKKNGNPDFKTWKEILDKYDIDGIPFEDGYPDFSEVSSGEVKIDDFTTERWKNFAQADDKMAEEWSKSSKDGKADWTADDVAQWRKENNHTWHEHQDCKTMQLVPSEVHNNIPHNGGISVKKQEVSNGGQA
ncbi:HNH endonuclease [Volucribacter amazonae]|uniref:HNH/ENDO VII superfamily nuclease n=1 Tax=Volucribacter amazonae TaxID=256731 RepID=A0A9X4PE97_9PAST|nr:HNH endonuclease [Volucribacter amazonae]MDG6896064.1 hypothetical protein [Volucribacter amazonae]